MKHNALATLLWLPTALAGSLSDIKNVVFMLQGGRSFDHYFGTMSGVRGFSDPNFQINSDGDDVFAQQPPPSLSKSGDTLLPWHASYLQGNYTASAQCMTGGDDGWSGSQTAWNGGSNNHWPWNSPYSMAYFDRLDIPTHFEIAEAYTIADMYQESIMPSINSNRVFLFSGSAGIPNGPQQASEGGPVLLNTDNSFGCHHNYPDTDCYPLQWHPIMKYLQDAGVTWQVYQDDPWPNAFGAREILSGFQDFNASEPGSPLYERGLANNNNTSLAAFINQALNGTLPQVSWVISDESLSETPLHRPQDGAWQQLQVIEAVTSGHSMNSTALFVSYDDAGGWFDHVPPTHSLNGTAGEWIQDPFGQAGYTIAGPGFRVPFYIVSPWTTGGNVFTEHADHSSQIMFLEKWLQAQGLNVKSAEINPWRRQYMSNLVNAFDFNKPNYTVPKLQTVVPVPPTNLTFLESFCMTQYPENPPPVPKTLDRPETLAVESGFKQIRGDLTVGRYLVFELNGYALTNGNVSDIAVTPATPLHDNPNQSWVIEQYEAFGTNFKLFSFTDHRYIENMGIVYLGSGQGYSLFHEGAYWTIDTKGNFKFSSTAVGFEIYSVNYGNEGWT